MKPEGRTYLVTVNEARTILGISETTEWRMRRDGSAPRWCMVGSRVMYCAKSLDEYLESKLSGVEPVTARSPVPVPQLQTIPDVPAHAEAEADALRALVEEQAKSIEDLTQKIGRLYSRFAFFTDAIKRGEKKDGFNALRRALYAESELVAVYVVSDGLGRLKVGKTRNMDSRMKTLRTSCPDLAVVHVFDGYSGIEKRLHAALADSNVGGEWFTDTPEVREKLKQLYEGAYEL